VRVRNDFIFEAYAFTSRVPSMQRSKTELYVSTLKALTYYGPMSITKIAYKVKMNGSQLKEMLDGLIQKKLVEERTVSEKRVIYAATAKAETALSYFEELKEMLPVVEDDTLTLTPQLEE
jgi:predicted transcriptional regulator